MRVAVCDFGAGNVRSVLVALARLGADAHLTREPGEVVGANLAVLPGVGSAASAMRQLRASGLDDALRERMSRGRPTLGICLGLQLALEESEEDGGVTCLGLLPGRAERLREGRVPRMGWARVEAEATRAGDPAGAGAAPLLDGDFYFAHSYAAATASAVARSEGIVAAAASGSFLGVQFHPEKSGPLGARFLSRCLSRA